MVTRLGLIGCGEIATSQHIPAVLRNPESEIVLVCDTNAERARSTAAGFAIPSWTGSADEVWDHPLDGLILATPPSVTPRIARQALESGLPVLCEKPIAVDLGTAEALVEVQAAAGVPCQVGYKNRFAPAIVRLRSWLDALDTRHGLLARVHSFDETWHEGDDDEEFVLRTQRTLAIGDPIVHEGTHHIDLVTWLLGPIESVITTARLRLSTGAALEPRYNGAYLRLVDGGMALVETGWCFPHSIKGEIQLWAPTGFAEVSRNRSTVTINTGGAVTTDTFAYDWQAAAFDGQLQSFLDVIGGGDQIGATVSDACEALRIALEIAQASPPAH